MKFQEAVYNVGYPVYGARFLNNNVLLVAGGGGEGNNGIPNKLTALQLNFEKRKVIKRFRELTLDENDDSPTTLDAANNVILMGCNENSTKIKTTGENLHLRKYVYENDHLKFVASVDMDHSSKFEDYTKLTYMSQDGTVAAIASSELPTVIRIMNPNQLTETYEIETGNDVKDLHFSPDGKVLSYITQSSLEVISIVTGRFIVRKIDFDKNWALSKIKFIGEDTVLIAAALRKGNGIVLSIVSLKSGTTSVLKSRIVTTKFRGVTSMDVDPTGQLAALAGNDNSVALVRLKNLTVAKFIKQVHSFAITKVAFSPDSKILASVSAANTIHAILIPDNLGSSSSLLEKLVKLLINFVLIVAVAGFAQLSYKYDLHSKAYHFGLAKWNARKDSFIMNDVFRQTTLVGDVVSIETHTRLPDTDSLFIHTPSITTTPSLVNSVSLQEKDSASSSDLSYTISWESTASASSLVSESTKPDENLVTKVEGKVDEPEFRSLGESNPAEESTVTPSSTAATEDLLSLDVESLVTSSAMDVVATTENTISTTTETSFTKSATSDPQVFADESISVTKDTSVEPISEVVGESSTYLSEDGDIASSKETENSIHSTLSSARSTSASAGKITTKIEVTSESGSSLSTDSWLDVSQSPAVETIAESLESKGSGTSLSTSEDSAVSRTTSYASEEASFEPFQSSNNHETLASSEPLSMTESTIVETPSLEPSSVTVTQTSVSVTQQPESISLGSSQSFSSLTETYHTSHSAESSSKAVTKSSETASNVDMVGSASSSSKAKRSQQTTLPYASVDSKLDASVSSDTTLHLSTPQSESSSADENSKRSSPHTSAWAGSSATKRVQKQSTAIPNDFEDQFTPDVGNVRDANAVDSAGIEQDKEDSEMVEVKDSQPSPAADELDPLPQSTPVVNQVSTSQDVKSVVPTTHSENAVHSARPADESTEQAADHPYHDEL